MKTRNPNPYREHSSGLLPIDFVDPPDIEDEPPGLTEAFILIAVGLCLFFAGFAVGRAVG